MPLGLFLISSRLSFVVRSRYAYTLIRATSSVATFSAGYCLDPRENEIPYKFREAQRTIPRLLAEREPRESAN